jgi:hypothetical protein
VVSDLDARRRDQRLRRVLVHGIGVARVDPRRPFSMSHEERSPRRRSSCNSGAAQAARHDGYSHGQRTGAGDNFSRGRQQRRSDVGWVPSECSDSSLDDGHRSGGPS